MNTEPAAASGLPMIRVAYAHGRTLQRDAGSTVWPEFSDEAILDEVERGILFALLERASRS